jgi:DNA-binding transcriptional regulator YhcF (GntR family)
MARRRQWAGGLPQEIAALFPQAQRAVLAVIAAHVRKHGDCRLTVGHLAALAGVSASTVRSALREARHMGLISVEERRLSGFRNDTNIVRITSPSWAASLHKGGGCNLVRPTNPFIFNPVKNRPSPGFKSPLTPFRTNSSGP